MANIEKDFGSMKSKNTEKKGKAGYGKSIFKMALPMLAAGLIAVSAAKSIKAEVAGYSAAEYATEKTQSNMQTDSTNNMGIEYDNYNIGGQGFRSMKFESPAVRVSDKVDMIFGVERSIRSATVSGMKDVTHEEVSYPSSPFSRREIVPPVKLYIGDMVSFGTVSINFESLSTQLYPIPGIPNHAAILKITEDGTTTTKQMTVPGGCVLKLLGQDTEILVNEVYGGATPLDSWIELKINQITGPSREQFSGSDLIIDTYILRYEVGSISVGDNGISQLFGIYVCDLKGNKIMDAPVTTLNGYGSTTVELPNGDKLVIDAVSNGMSIVSMGAAILRKNTTITVNEVETTYNLRSDDTNFLVGLGLKGGPVSIKLLACMLDRIEEIDSVAAISNKILPRIVVEGEVKGLKAYASLDPEIGIFRASGILDGLGTGIELGYENSKNAGNILWETERTASKLKQRILKLFDERFETGLDCGYERAAARVSCQAGSRQDSSESAGYGLYCKYNDKEKQLCIESGVSKQVSLPQQDTKGFMAFVKAKYRGTSIEASTQSLGNENDTRARVIWGKKF